MAYRFHNSDQLRALAASFPSVTAFRKSDPSACDIADSRGILDEIFPNRKKYRSFSESELISYGLSFKTRNGFRKGDQSSYTKARLAGLLDKMFPESSHKGQDNNAVYLMRVLGEVGLFKIGATSMKNAHRRGWQQDRFAKKQHVFAIPPTKVIGKATDVEKYALSLGINPGYTGFDGCTEYRIYSDEDVRLIKEMVELCRA